MAGELQSMSQYWKSFDLLALQKELDTTATDLASRQDESDASRKRLVEQSRDFKKNTAEDVRKTVAPLLKSFQSEIDALSKRSKAAEAAFLSVYKKLIDVPDPVPVLEHSLTVQKKAQRLSDLEIENKQLRETLDEYNSEFAEVKNQEFTIKQLKEKLKEYEETMEATAQSRASEKERELQRQFAEKEKSLQEKQMEIVRRLGEQEQRVAELNTALETTQSELFEARNQYDQLASAKASEMELMSNDLDRANEKIALSQRDAEKLRQQLASANQNLHQAEEMQKAPDVEQAIDIIKRSSLEIELAAKEKEVTQLVEDVHKLQATISKLYDTGSSQVAKLEEELQVKRASLTVLEEKLKTQEDYDEIKRELAVLKSIEYNEVSEKNQENPKTLEQLLLEKNRSLQTENTQLKVSNRDLAGTSGQCLSRMDVFASMIGQELALKYHLTKSSPYTLPQHALSSPLPSGCSPSNSSQSSPHSSLYKSQHSENGELDLSLPKSRSQSESGDVLDTAAVSLKIREILSVHNIGQRMFAKHVLGLSQGTVSELLSKPKHWDKLTEKGRESYRKMANWANDENNIMLLKSLSPKKGNNCVAPGVKQEDSATEERICRILNEAQNAMKMKQSQEQMQTSAIVNNIYQEQLDKINHERSSSTSSTHRTRADQEVACAVSQDMVTRIYREELTKLVEIARLNGNVAESTHYQQELAKLAINAHHKDVDDSQSPRVKEENSVYTNGHCSSGEVVSRHAGSAFCLVRPRSNGTVGLDLTVNSSSKATESASPLQRMQNIANSVLGLGKSQALLQFSSKPLKAVLPPISQEQFDKYATIDTDKLVGQIKECLSQYSISQRLFGECVLGLSQGSVSDLLARPKPWNMLTQKGREPFIRMKIFLEDEDVIQRLVSNQYKMIPDKCSRSAAHHPASPSLAVEGSRSPMIASRSSRSETPSGRRSSGHDHSLYDMALMTHDLDTLAITASVKEVLQFHNVGQKLFGEVILGLSQGSVSELLSKPKPWHLLSLKGREPFVKMHWWLQDPTNIERLKLYQCEMKAYRKRSNSLDDRSSSDSLHPPVKKPRVSFTDEQKEVLRLAYLRDPYPSTSSIDTLAKQIGVGSRTVVNWFHNHRMRSKQHHLVDGVVVKSEYQEDSSNNSDDNTYQITESSQWMFPSFEAVGTDMANMPKSPECRASSVKNECASESEAESKSCEDIKQDSESMPIVTTASVNKRKSAKPQRICEPSHADAGSHNDLSEIGNSSDDTEIKISVNSGQSENNNIEISGGTNGGSGLIVNSLVPNETVNEIELNRKKKLEKLRCAIETVDLEWDEVDRDGNISKMEQNLEDKNGDEWEF